MEEVKRAELVDVIRVSNFVRNKEMGGAKWGGVGLSSALDFEGSCYPLAKRLVEVSQGKSH